MLRVANESFSNNSLKIHLLVLSSLYEDILRVLGNKIYLGYRKHEIGPKMHLHIKYSVKQNNKGLK